MPHRLLLAALLLLASLWAGAAPLVVTLRLPESETDPRAAYDHAVIRLALEKTLASHGPYTLQFAPPMTAQRALLSAEQQHYPGFLIVSVPRPERTAAGLVPVRVPLHLGTAGYRVCFVSPKAQAAVAKARTLDELRRFTIAQAAGWTDGAILRANGFKVEEVVRYEAMFKMVAQSRFDLFCRSVLEISKEVESHADQTDLLLDKTFALVYDLPQFFYTHRDNHELVERLTQGLETAYVDGSLLALFNAHMQPSIRFADLAKRRVFRLKTPPISGIDFDYKRYDVDLTRDTPRELR